MPWIPSLAALRALDGAERRLLVEATAYLAVSRMLVILVPFRRLAPLLARKASVEGGTGAQEGLRIDPSTTRDIAHAIGRAARHVPWNAVCLPQAMAAKAMLGRRGIDAQLHLGAGFDRSGKLIAHAWLMSDGAVVIGGDGMTGVTPLTSFG